MSGEVKKISVVVPVYNSASVLNELADVLEKCFATLNLSYQLVLVDDCSKDDSWKVIKEIKANNPGKVTAIRMAKNFSQHNAIFCGFRYCNGDLILTIDDDLQHPVEEISKLIACQAETDADVVYGVSKQYKRSFVRNFFSKGYRVSAKLTAPDYTAGSSFRLMKNNLVKNIITHNQQFVFVDELISWYTTSIKHVSVLHNPSKLNTSRYSGAQLAKLYWDLVFGYNAALLKMITYLGLSSSFVSFVVGSFFIVKKIFYHTRIGFTGIVVSITFTGGIILLSIGIIGEYMRRMYNILNERPQYSIREILE
jgi:glycosyltransferase involved in cell wall biosynthesis